MENIKDVLMRIHHLTEKEAQEIIERSKKKISDGSAPEEVLLDEYGSDVEYLNKILNPAGIS